MAYHDEFSKACNQEDHNKCDVMWCACPHHLSEEVEDDPYEKFDARVEVKGETGTWTVTEFPGRANQA